jgi:hypothetical protein
MPSYKVVLQDKTDVRVTAEDVCLECCCDSGDSDDDNDDLKAPPRKDHVWWNFTNKEDTTVAAFPFNQVLSITS